MDCPGDPGSIPGRTFPFGNHPACLAPLLLAYWLKRKVRIFVSESENSNVVGAGEHPLLAWALLTMVEDIGCECGEWWCCVGVGVHIY